MTNPLERRSDLAARIADGDKEAESEMVQLYEPGMRRVLHVRADRPADIDDLVNDVWALALPKLRRGELREFGALASYLNSFARRVASNYLRRADRKLRTDDTDFVESQASAADGPYARLKWAQVREITARVLDEMKLKRDKEILERFLVYGEEKDLICAQLEVTNIHFNKLLQRARRRFIKLATPYLLEVIRTPE